MNIQPDIKLGFNDISLISRQISTIKSRDEIKISSTIFGMSFPTPIIAAPMKDVCNGKVAKEMLNLGGLGIVHRFGSLQEQYQNCLHESGISSVYAIGINGDFKDRYRNLVEIGAKRFCIDVANSSSSYVKDAIKDLLEIKESQFIVGNVISREGISFYDDLPQVVGFRVSVASGKACTTKNATGMFYPPVSLLLECRDSTDKVIIADGGIKEPQDYCKAIACGADFIMLGSLICQTKDSPGEIIMKDGKEFKLYHGSASYENQKLYKDVPKYIEGRTVLLEFKNESLQELLSKFQEGLKSSMSYANARTLEEYRTNVELIKIL